MVFGFCALTARTASSHSKQNTLLYAHEPHEANAGFGRLKTLKREGTKLDLASSKALAGKRLSCGSEPNIRNPYLSLNPNRSSLRDLHVRIASVRCVILLSNARDHSLTISAATFDMFFRAVIAAALVGCAAA